ncbi:hypothetical protein NEF87_000090 [Candidatus Lokiarchaeum ossiferum]|uniref:N-acetyltransferase domain-containing protein n=1 Tax=Candidatus Lokiarchaeum ossiferum TaxID=2951803 RepID=A0ABY6HK90_9ARCH|nr:hypothetical protein NEF87_000090 [Candidatus Lokiarchaeum sp. B-35]
MIGLDFTHFPVLESKYYKLRQLQEKDAQAIFEYQSNKINFLYVNMPVYTNLSQARKYIEEKNQGVIQNKWIIWAITKKNNNHIVGTVSIWNFDQKCSKAELGYGLFSGNTGKGIMTEVLSRVILYGFNELHLEIIEAYTNPSNKKSIALLKRLNFKYKMQIEEDGELLNIFRQEKKEF